MSSLNHFPSRKRMQRYALFSFTQYFRQVFFRKNYRFILKYLLINEKSNRVFFNDVTREDMLCIIYTLFQYNNRAVYSPTDMQGFLFYKRKIWKMVTDTRETGKLRLRNYLSEWTERKKKTRCHEKRDTFQGWRITWFLHFAMAHPKVQQETHRSIPPFFFYL